MNTEVGEVHDVRIENAGSYLAVAASLGATSITVEDSADFLGDGGSLSITSMDTDGVTLVTTQYDYTVIDQEADTITLTTGLVTAGLPADRVDRWPLAPVKQAAVVLTGTGDAITARVPHQLMDLMPEGIRDDVDHEFVNIVLQNGEWVVTDVFYREPSIQSQNFDESTSGWVMDAETTQFDNANVIGTVGADTVSAQYITLGDEDLGTRLDSIGLGVLAQASIGAASSDTATVSANTMMFTFTCSNLSAARLYKITYSAAMQGTVSGDVFVSRVYYTEDGTPPTLVGIIPGSVTSTIMSAGSAVMRQHSFYYSPVADVDTLSLGFAIQRQTGTGTCSVLATNINQPFYFSVEDVGPTSNITGTLSQKSKATGTVDADPTTTTTKLFYSTDSLSYDADSGLRKGDESGYDCYQGRFDATHGTTKSAIQFDDAAIRAALVGATILSVRLTFRVKHTYYNGGVNVHIRDHNVSPLPSTYPGGSEIAFQNTCVEGAMYTVDLPVSFGNALKNGTARGCGFFAPSTSLTYYGYMYGANAGPTRPRLSITYSK